MILFLDHQRFNNSNNFQKSHLKITKIHFGNNRDKIKIQIIKWEKCQNWPKMCVYESNF